MTDSARRSPVVNNYLATAPDLTEAELSANKHYVWNEDGQSWDLTDLII